ncbi:hypothetical protein NQ317_019088 [Molorchus minor]|uniref:acylaminoacyl-peptidase n=1 Tax=Molorchus minor TaxID=1323400 RepID=A0ABQ9JMK2_9CUCU|nr:hypothetical protein NQ317_019088 [Molorchus minor]
MSSRIEKIVKTYRSLTQTPSLVAANIRSNGILSTTWSQRNLEKGKATKFLREIFTTDLKKIAEGLPVDVSNELLSRNSATEKFRAVLRENDSKQYIEVWQNQNIIRTVDLAALDVHGSVYSDVEFASLEWSPNEQKLLYVVEKKVPKSEPFYKRKGPSPNENGNNANGTEEKTKTIGEEYLFTQDWGEQLVGKKRSILAEYDIESDTVEILKGIPDDVCIAQPKYSPDGSYIVGIAYEVEPRKLGVIYCSNRPSTIFKLDLEGNFLKLPLCGYSVKSPIFSPDEKSLVWLQRKTGGPHHAAMQLVKTSLPLTENSTPTIVVDVVDTERKIHNGKTFYGLYNTGFPKRPWASKNRLLLNTPQKYTIKSYVVNLDTGDITELEFVDGSQLIVDVNEDKLLAVRRNYFRVDQLFYGKLPSAGSEETITWTEVTDCQVINGLEPFIYKYLDLSADSLEGDCVSSFNAIYLGPENGDKASVPFIIWPHGGPHSVISNYFILEAAMFLSFGFAIVFVNYRGSIGSGQKSVDFLLGKVGTSDVSDCIVATDKALEIFPWLNPDSIVLVGGSHGGFLVAHLSGQYPDKFKAVVARNPVIDLASMSVISDIPDWCYVEAGKEYTQKGEIESEILLEMRKVSPIVHAHKVKAPTLLQIGTKDLRVPCHQGTEYYLRLKANGVTTKMNLYDDNHTLGTVTNETDNIINTLLWIQKHLGIDEE